MSGSDWQDRLAAHRDAWDDFWGRRQAAPTCERAFRVFGRAARLRSNDEAALAAVDEALPQYSEAEPDDGPAFEIQVVARPFRRSPGPAPDDLVQRITYTGDGPWLMTHLGGWGQAMVDLERREARAVITPSLAARPDLVAFCLLHNILLNLFIADGYGMLHASALWRGEHALLLLAPHNSGKSTTALRLALAGFRLISDSMVFVAPGSRALLGFPVGRIQLRADMVPAFPGLAPLLTPRAVRDETKHGIDLRRLDPGLVQARSAAPARVTLCLLRRGGRAETRVTPASDDEMWAAVLRNSLYYDRDEVWARNLDALAPLLTGARAVHLAIGREPAGIVAAAEGLVGDGG